MSEEKSVAQLRAELEAAKAALEKKLSSDRAAKIAEVRAVCDEYGITADDIFNSRKGAKTGARNPVAPKYKDPDTGATWTGRGKPPLWIAGAADRTVYEIKGE